MEVKCYLLVLQYDHQVKCTGKIIYSLFGQTKIVTIFNFKKSVVFSWNWIKQYNGQWSFNLWIGLPSPVNFIGISLKFKINYVIDLQLNANTVFGFNPYTFKVAALATTQVNTAAEAALRLLVIEGGVFMNGVLLKVGTDPALSLYYYFSQKKLKIITTWYFWILTFQYKWGFFYRYWKFWSGWSSKKIIKQWNIKGYYGKWKIISKTWYVNW